MHKSEAVKLYKELYWVRFDLCAKDEPRLDNIIGYIQEKFCKRGCRNGDLTDGGLFTPIHWCDCPLGVEAASARVTIV